MLQGEAETDDYVAKVLFFGGAGAALLVMVTLLLSVRVRRSIVRPIRALAAQATSVARHDLPEAVDAVAELPADAAVPRSAGLRGRPATTSSASSPTASTPCRTPPSTSPPSRPAPVAWSRRTSSTSPAATRTCSVARSGFISTLEQSERDPGEPGQPVPHRPPDHAHAPQRAVAARAGRRRADPPVGAARGRRRRRARRALRGGELRPGRARRTRRRSAVTGSDRRRGRRTCSPNCWRTPPASRRRRPPVTVVGRAVPDGHQLAIFDYGLGMTTEDMAAANERLNQVSSFDRESSKMLGFQVVARLAARHDIKVMLTTTPGGSGVTADRAPAQERSSRVGRGSPTDPETTARLADAARGVGVAVTQPLPIVADDRIEPMSLASLESSLSHRRRRTPWRRCAPRRPPDHCRSMPHRARATATWRRRWPSR